MAHPTQHEAATATFFRTTVSLPAALESFVSTRASQEKHAGSTSSYFRELVLCDQARRVRFLKADDSSVGVFRTTITLPSSLLDFITQRAGGNVSGYLCRLVRADYAAFINLPARQRPGWRSPKRKAVRR